MKMDSWLSYTIGFVVVSLTAGYLFFKSSNKNDEQKKPVIVKKNNRLDSDTMTEEERAKKYPGGKISVFFGSQTGTSEGFARILHDEGKKNGFDMQVEDLEDFEVDKFLNCRIAIFLVATYGEGEPTDNAVEFFRWLKNDDQELSSDILKENNVSFTVFGLGNRDYEHYNAIGKKCFKLLTKYGGECVYEYGEGDDSGTLEEDFEAWKENLWPELIKKFHKQPALTLANAMNDDYIPDLDFKVEFINNINNNKKERSKSSDISPSTKYYFTSVDVKVIKNIELRNNEVDPLSTRHIELDVRNTALENYTTADNLAILPLNDINIVERISDKLNIDLDSYITLKPLNDHWKLPFPTPCTIRDLLLRYIDLNGEPRIGLCQSLIPFVKNNDEKERLKYYTSKEGRHEYHEMIQHNKYTIADLFLDLFPSIEIPLDHFIYSIPHIQPRYYTISSSSSVYPERIHITVALIDEELNNGRQFQGITSKYIKDSFNLPETNKGRRVNKNEIWPTCRVFLRPSTFRLPPNPYSPIIMIGPGTGIAPMRALLQERRYQRVNEDCEVGPNILYFGCRRSDGDYIYHDELENYLDEGILDKLYLAFSREGPKKVYVQHLLAQEENSNEFWELISENNAYVYVCGGTLMGHDIMETCINIIQNNTNSNHDEATKYMKSLQEEGRYIQELWS